MLKLLRNLSLIFLCVLFKTPLARAMEIFAENDPTKRPGHYLIVLKDHSFLQSSMNESERGELLETYKLAFAGYHIKADQTQIQSWLADPAVAHIEADRIFSIAETQTKDLPWGLDRIDSRVGLDRTYNYGLTGKGVHAYVLDTGIRSSHQEFSGRMGEGYSSVDDGRGSDDCNGHGTHVAATLGGTSYGVAKQIKLHPVRVLDCQGAGSLSGIISGVEWVSKNAELPAVANMSLGGGMSPALQVAVQNAIEAGIVFVVAAGNSRTDACTTSPANIKEAITVASTDRNDKRSSFSNYGSCVDIFAPGDKIKSAWRSSDRATKTISGTSMASPHVAGVVALRLEERPEALAEEAVELLLTDVSYSLVKDAGYASPNRLLFSNPFGEAPQDPPPPTDDIEPPSGGSCGEECTSYEGVLTAGSKLYFPSAAGFQVSGGDDQLTLMAMAELSEKGVYGMSLQVYSRRPPRWNTLLGLSFRGDEFFMNREVQSGKYRWVLESLSDTSVGDVVFSLNQP